jgi:hypothetical protein
MVISVQYPVVLKNLSIAFLFFKSQRYSMYSIQTIVLFCHQAEAAKSDHGDSCKYLYSYHFIAGLFSGGLEQVQLRRAVA